MKIAIISDTHTYHNELELPEVDILFHTGDFTGSRAINYNKIQTNEFLTWFSNQKANHKIFIAGNHDLYIEHLSKRGESNSYIKENYPDLIYLEDSSVNIDGKIIYGTPWCPIFYNWAFMKDDEKLTSIFNKIPAKTDILLTHTPAFGILDEVQRGNVGSRTLLNRIEKLKKIKYHFHGHIHEGYGINEGRYKTINGSMLNEWGYLNKPIIIDI